MAYASYCADILTTVSLIVKMAGYLIFVMFMTVINGSVSALASSIYMLMTAIFVFWLKMIMEQRLKALQMNADTVQQFSIESRSIDLGLFISCMMINFDETPSISYLAVFLCCSPLCTAFDNLDDIFKSEPQNFPQSRLQYRILNYSIVMLVVILKLVFPWLFKL